MVAVRLLFRDLSGEDLGVHFVCANGSHAPAGTAAQAKWDMFFSDLSTCSDKRCAGDVLVLAIDGNASIGIESSGDWGETTPCVIGENACAATSSCAQDDCSINLLREEAQEMLCDMVASKPQLPRAAQSPHSHLGYRGGVLFCLYLTR